MAFTIWKHSWRDIFPFTLTLVQLAGSVWLAMTWESRTVWELGLLWPLFLFLFWYNPIISTHNFLHTPWFRREPVNNLYRALNSINLGLPQILYRHHHLNHHRYNNDPRPPEEETLDHSSTFAFGRDGHHEPMFPYCALGLFRKGTTKAYEEARRKGQLGQFWFELLVCVGGLTGLALLSWQYLVFFYVPTFYFGWFLAHMENYYEHYAAADPADRYADSVSYYGPIYNRLFCNEGYHQEHHLRPQVHWTRRPGIKREHSDRLEASDRIVSRVPPLLGFLERRPNEPCRTDESS